MNRRKSCSSHGDHHLEQSEPWRDGWVSNHLCHWLSRTYTNTPRFRRKAGARSLDDDHISVDYLSLSYSFKYPIVHEKFQETVRSVASQLLGTLGCDTDKVFAIDTSRCDALSRMDKNWLTDYWPAEEAPVQLLLRSKWYVRGWWRQQHYGTDKQKHA